MTRSEKAITEVSYRVSRLELLDAARDLIQAKYPGGALVGDRRNHRQDCSFIDGSGQVLQVTELLITTTYEEP